MKPDASRHNPDPRYLRGLLDKAGLTQEEAAVAIGISGRMMRYYLAPADGSGGKHHDIPYRAQYALEGLLPDESKES